MATAQTLIIQALRKLGAVAPQETPATAELNDALDVLNSMIDEWRTQHLSVYFKQNVQQALTADQGEYTIGTGGDINVPRPTKIESAGIIDSLGLRHPLELYPSTKWAEIPEKDASAKLPLALYNDSDHPLSTLHLWPVPKVLTSTTLDLVVWARLVGTLSLGTTVDLPPGYWESLVYNLAVELAPEWGRVDGPTLQMIQKRADEAKADLGGWNASNNQAVEDPPPANPPQAA